jgi:NAD(P)-dependent dehydrogenase (short-subunit alcohol dehydrogenase family)
MDLGLHGKAVIITGGSRGIGLETGRRFADEGARVLLCARRDDALAEAAADIKGTTGVTVETVAADVTRPPELDKAVTTALELFGSIDVLVNNAGTGTYKPFLEVTEEELEYGMSINFFAQFRMCQRVVPHMIRQGGGSIVNVSGETGIRVTPAPFLSSCTGPAKAAEIRFSKILASELGPHGIRVNCVVPGLVYTPERFAKWEREMVGHELTGTEADEIRAQWARHMGTARPGQQWATPQEVSALIAFAASGAVPSVTGAALVIDSGEDKS